VTAALRRVPRAAVTQARSYRILVPGVLVALALLTGLVLVVAGGILLGAVPVQAGRGGAALPADWRDGGVAARAPRGGDPGP